MTLYFLRSNALAEPLIHQWYAWPMLISPATLALTMAKSQMSILRSYIQMPKMHDMAVRDPKMRGGPFMDFNGENKVQAVEAFLATMQDNHLIQLADALIALNERLAHADGHTLNALYDEVPDVLKGYVELVYDVNNRPHYRLIEGLLYRSDFYNVQAQSMMLSTLHEDQRAFVLSTPRLGLNDELVWTIPFNHSDVDWLFKSREYGVELCQLEDFFKRHFGDNQHKQQQLMSLFTTTPPQKRSDHAEDEGVRIRYFGHACVLIETQHTSILIDPMMSYGYETSIERFTYEDLPPRIDYVLLTHAHQDHVMFEHLLQLRYKIGTIVVPKNVPGMIQDPSLKLMLKQIGFKQVIELDEMESIPLPQGEILGVPFLGEHGDLHIQSKLAYIVKAAGKTILLAADSDNIEPKLYEHLQREVPNIDVIFLGMECDGAPMSWLYGALLPSPLQRSMDQSRRLNGSNCERAMDIVRRFNPQEVYVYAMGQEPWLGYITSIEYTETAYPIVESNRFIATCQAEGRYAERLFLKKEIRLCL